MNRPCALLCTTLALAACGQNESVTVGSSDHALYGLGSIDKIWPGGIVPVCFANPNDQPTLQTKLRDILANSWSKAANIHFTGFGSCSGGNEVAVGFVAGWFGSTTGVGYGGTRHVALISDDSTPDLSLFTQEALHELGHAIGWEHEMMRPDNWNGGVAVQCGPGNGSTDVNQFNPVPGGLTLTANYDPDSIMNYCRPGGTTLSVGDILGASSASAYGPTSSCSFTATSTACTPRTGHFDSTFTVPSGCPPTTGSWVLKQVGVGPVATAPEANTFVLGQQSSGGVTSGPAIGSSPTYQMCDAFNNCGAPFKITIRDCDTQDEFYVAYNQTLYVTQGGNGFETLEMTGPWVNGDAGVNAYGGVVSSNLPNASFNLSRGYAHSTACAITGCIGFMDLTVSASLTTPVGDYTAVVAANDLASHVTRVTVTPIHVSACTPPPSSCAAEQCGTFNGCGKSLDCGSCSGTDVCSAHHCCPQGSEWDGNECSTPPCNCKPGFYCDDTGTCVRNGTCKPGTCQ